MSRPSSRYHLQEQVVRLLETTNLDLNGLRLFHGLYAFVDKVVTGGVSMLTLDNVPTPPIFTAELVRYILPTSTNDLDSLRAGLVSLQATNLFSHLKHDTARHRVEVRFASPVTGAAARLKNGRYAALDADRVRACNSAAEILYYTRAIMHRGANHPMFHLPKSGEEAPWTTNAMRRWVRAARVFSLVLDQMYVLQPTSCPMSGDRTGVTVKITHGKTAWSPGCLYDRNPRHMPIVVIAGTALRLDRDELQRRHHWRYADRP